MVASANAPSITPERAWTFALNKVSSEPAHENLTCAMTVSASSPFGEGHDEGKDAEGLVRCHRQTHHGQAYSAMDYYFDHLKKTIASAPSGGTEFRVESESLCEAK